MLAAGQRDAFGREYRCVRAPRGLQYRNQHALSDRTTNSDCIPGESRDPLVNSSICGTVDPGFRRECEFFVGPICVPEPPDDATQSDSGIRLREAGRAQRRAVGPRAAPAATDRREPFERAGHALVEWLSHL